MIKSNNKPAAMPTIIIWRAWRSTAILRNWAVAGGSVTIVSLPDISTFDTFSKAGRGYERNNTLPRSPETPLSSKARGSAVSLCHIHTESISSVIELISPFCLRRIMVRLSHPIEANVLYTFKKEHMPYSEIVHDAPLLLYHELTNQNSA